MKKNIVWILVLGIGISAISFWYFQMGERIRVYFQTPPYGKNWQNEITKQKELYTGTYDLVFIGDSHMEQCEWHELFPNQKVANRGIGGETTGALLVRLDNAIKPGTQWVMLQIGINDLLSGVDTSEIINNYREILQKFEMKKVKAICTLPFFTRYRPEVEAEQLSMNQTLEKEIKKSGFICLDLNPVFAPTQKMEMAFSSDGVHLNAKGYRIWAEKIHHLMN
jgi:hypothetical protein